MKRQLILFSLMALSQICSSSWTEVANITIPNTFFGMSGQGVGSEGEYIYWSGKDILKQSTVGPNINITVTKSLFPAIPLRMVELNYDHIGDIDVFEGTIYAPIEEPNYTRPAIARYSSELEFIDFVATRQHHMPWVAVDPATKLLYSSEFDNVTFLYVYDTQQKLAFQGLFSISVPAVQTLTAIQGGFIYDNLLYLSSSWNHTMVTVYVVDMETGKWLPDQTFYVNSQGEVEGLTVTSNGDMYFVQNHVVENHILELEETN
eukprot:CAMPEP_0168567584 /NCGR_PEP_ID=MMETSP0413-20121227/15089_1 /TAXON_ID=136452 /ORGANISM="Filamoeba nolandi, Strain NC-AS-23-1" /LENGTH=261 /DNA_ID=CAMNT_0008599797 /DNA_START=65 /DNA_END=850 /DNA_ORIENTATION=-